MIPVAEELIESLRLSVFTDGNRLVTILETEWLRFIETNE
jgi:hypothetical protein